jgi:hypothetical protein
MRRLILASALLLAACEPAGDNQAESAADNAASAQGANVAANGDGPVLPVRDPDAPVASDDPPTVPPPDSPAPDCPILGSSGWRAHVDVMPGPNVNPRLIVSGRVTVPTGGYRLSLRMGPVAQSYPVQVTVILDAVPPSGPATQAVETRTVRGDWPMGEPVGAVTVRCGSRALARLGNIGTAH